MKTRHISFAGSFGTYDILDALHDAKIDSSYVRAVNCGRGVIILPDTNRKADCTEGEIIKALGLVKKYDGLHLEGGMKSEDEKPRKLVSMQYEYDTPDVIALTDDQIRLLDWLNKRSYLSESISFNYLNSFEIEKI